VDADADADAAAAAAAAALVRGCALRLDLDGFNGCNEGGMGMGMVDTGSGGATGKMAERGASGSCCCCCCLV